MKHLKGDRKDYEALKSTLANKGFQVVYDINGTFLPPNFHCPLLSPLVLKSVLSVRTGREAEEVAPILEAIPNLEQ